MAKACAIWIWNFVVFTKILYDIAAMDKYRPNRSTKNCVAYGCHNVADAIAKAAGISFHAYVLSSQECIAI